MHNVNAEDTRLMERAEAIVAPILEGTSVGSEALAFGPAISNGGLAFAPVSPALALAQ